MKIRYAPLAVACALMVAAVATTTAQAAAVTYYFGGTLDTVPGGPSLAIGDAFTGSFTFESTALDGYSNPALDATIGVYYTGTAVEATVNGHTYASTSACTACTSITVYDNFSGVDTFIASSGGLGAVAGASLDGFSPLVLFVALNDRSGTVFNSDALPSSLTFASFNEASFEIGFAGDSTRLSASGPLTYLSTTAPVPEASTSAMLALGLGALAVVRRRKGH